MQSSSTPSNLDTTTTTTIQSDPTRFHPTSAVPNYFSTSHPWTHYHSVRPVYPTQLFDLIYTYHSHHSNGASNFNLAADFGSGPGTIVPSLLTRFARVEASDINPWQVETGRRILQSHYPADADRVAFHQGAAEDPHWLADDSVDLFTAAEAVQWFDFDKWGREAGRKLKRGGTLAMWYYGCNATIVEPVEAAPLCNKLFSILFETTWSQSGFPKRALLPHVTKLDCLSLPSEYFDKDKEERHYWSLPASVAGPFGLGENSPTSRALFHEEELRSADASRGAKRFEYSGDDGEEGCFLRREGWTTADLLEYIKSLGMPMENLLSSPDYQPTLDALHDVLGGSEGTFTAGWWLSLVLATRK